MNFSGISDQTIIGKALRFPLRLIPANSQIPILQGPLRGKKWIVGSGNHGCWLGSYEHEKQKTFAAAIRAGYTVYDLGANVGFYSLLASVLVGDNGTVISFEPLPRNVEFLQMHLQLNAVTNCSVWQTAVGQSPGVGRFDVGPDPHMGHLNSTRNDGPEVEIVSLDDLVASGKIPPPNLIKCDIEGGEYDALTGAAGTLDKFGPTVFLATHGPGVHGNCCRLLADLRYRVTSLEHKPVDQSSELVATRHSPRTHEKISSITRETR